jgi:hypothetical protein
MKYVKVSAKVDRRMKTLMQSGKAGRMIAEKAADTIKNIKSGTILDYREPSGSFTKYGERRIKSCRKFDFACGYRLITLQRDSTIVVSFLGTHDECQRWLDNNGSLKEISPGKGTLFSIPDKKTAVEDRSKNHKEKYYRDKPFSEQLSNMQWCDSTTQISAETECSEIGCDEYLMNLSQQDLRSVFCGIVESVNKRRE